jgi:hypothetical protein
MKAQKIFDTVVVHLAKQGHRSMMKPKGYHNVCAYRDPNVCAYRGRKGDKCAAGILIPDNEYDIKMENVSFNGLIEDTNTFPRLKTVRSYKPHRKLISDLQSAHDFSDIETAPIYERLESVAYRHQLNTNVLKTLTFKEWK